MTDILGRLRRASWRDIEFPVMGSRDFGFQHDHAETRFLFKDVQLIESLGRKNPTYKYMVPFREDIGRGPWTNIFTTKYPAFLAACQDRTRGILVDPVHGVVPAKCVSLREVLDIGRRDGVDVEVEFVFAPAESETANVAVDLGGIQGARGMAGALDREVRKIDFQQRRPPEPTINPLDAGTAVLGQIEAGVNRVAAAFADAAFRAEKTIELIDRLKDPQNQPAVQQAKRLQAALLGIEERTDPTGTRPLRRVSTTVDRTVAATARILGMTLTELIRLNPALGRQPLIQARTELRVFADTVSKEDARAA